MKQPEILIIFAKNLIHGKVKTRLAATIGAERAFEVYKDLIANTVSIAQNLKADKIVYYSEKIEMEDMWNEHFLKAKQRGTDLGERMTNAFNDVFQQGYTKAVIIGTDCPSLNEHIIHDAFEDLNNNDVVIGPAFDGGYYLLGMKEPHPYLFKNVEWSTPAVFETTIAKCTSLHLKSFILPRLHDIDEEKDLVHLKTTRA